MIYFVTGASGFIGKRLVRKLLSREDAIVYFLMRDAAPERCAALRAFWDVDETRAIPVPGDLTEPGLGLSAADKARLQDKVDHVFHLAAFYDLGGDPELQARTNVAGTRHAVGLAQEIGAKRFHHMSSIAAAGLYPGVFREDMFEEATRLEHPYFASKHEGEKVVRSACRVPWRIYRPGIVVGDSRTGEMDKIDGPYYFFKAIQKIRGLLPPWMPAIGVEGGRINLVPVDFVVDALDHIAHLDGQDGRCFHLTDPQPHRFGDVLGIFARAAHAPAMTLRINAALFELIPKGLAQGLSSLTPVRRIQAAIMKDLGLPEGIFSFVNYPTRFDCRDAERLLEPAGITVPPLEDYAWRLWDHWERHLDPDLFIERSLRGHVAGRVVLVTGGSSGVGKAAALRIAEAGATTIIIARDPEKLEATRQEAAARGLEIVTHVTDLTDPAQCAALAKTLAEAHGGVDILVNNAGRSIRRSIENSYDRMHDFERMMAVNYFGALRLTMALLPAMAEKRRGHVVNVSSIGVLTNAPHFSAYVASKSAPRGLVALRGLGVPRPRRPVHHHQPAPGADPDDRADRDLPERPGPDARGGRRLRGRGHHPTAGADRHAARHLRPGPPRPGAAGRADHQQHRLSHVSGLGSGAGQEGREGGPDGGPGRPDPAAARRPLLAMSGADSGFPSRLRRIRRRCRRLQKDPEDSRREGHGEVADGRQHDLLRARQAAAVLGRDVVVAEAPDAEDGCRRRRLGQLTNPGAFGRHLPGVAPETEPRQPAAVVRRAQGDQLGHPVAAVAPQIGPGREAAHAVPDQHHLRGAGLREQGADPGVQDGDVAVDPAEGGLEIDRGDGSALRPEAASQPPPDPAVAEVAVDQQQGRRCRAAAGAVPTHPQALEGLDDGEENQGREPFQGHGLAGAPPARRQGRGRPVGVAAGVGVGHRQDRGVDQEAGQHAQGQRGGEAQPGAPGQQHDCHRYRRHHGQDPTQPSRDHGISHICRQSAGTLRQLKADLHVAG